MCNFWMLFLKRATGTFYWIKCELTYGDASLILKQYKNTPLDFLLLV